MTKLIDQRGLEEAEQKGRLDLLYRKQEELKREFRILDRQLYQGRITERDMPEDKNDLFDRCETEVLKLANRREKDRKRLTIMQDASLRRTQTTNI